MFEQPHGFGTVQISRLADLEAVRARNILQRLTTVRERLAEQIESLRQGRSAAVGQPVGIVAQGSNTAAERVGPAFTPKVAAQVSPALPEGVAMGVDQHRDRGDAGALAHGLQREAHRARIAAGQEDHA